MAVPGVPATVETVPPIASNRLHILWTVSSGTPTGYYIYRSEDDITYVKIATVLSPLLVYADGSVFRTTGYYYKVSGYNVDGESAQSTATALVTTLDKDSQQTWLGPRGPEYYDANAMYGGSGDIKFRLGLRVPTAEIGDITGDDKAEFEADGTLVFQGAATVFDDQQINISSAKLPSSGAPTWTAYKGSQVLAFSASQDNLIYFTAQLSHKYFEGSNIEFHIHTVHPDANAGTSIWNFTYSWADIGSDFPAITTLSSVSVTSPSDADKHELHEIAGSITGTGKGISSILLCSLEREGTSVGDNYASVVYLIAADFHIEMNTVGSRLEGSK